ncbi:MAG: uroporphyrinogen-III C-methyltransferase, partial [Clostridia bacterium]|nr:uroporphyrinogen-III C-methyltransferase [Clostridia bacterium]
ALRQAEVVIYDDLIDEGLLQDPALKDAEKLYVGKRRGAHSMSQEEINALLIAEGREGKEVVRLKGGDSFVFGRGGEEVLALQEAGLPFTVIPGVTSAVAVPEDFGIPVTHRGLSRSFTVITGHTADGSVGGESFDTLARLQGTLVFLMGVRNLTAITEGLLAAGKDPETPAALLSKGFSPDARRFDGTLQTIADLAKDAETPGILVVGEVAALQLEGQKPAPFEAAGSTPLSVSVIGTDGFCERFRDRCPEAVPYPLVTLEPNEAGLRVLQDDTVTGFSDYDWVAFLSGNAIDLFFDGVGDVRKLASLKFACVGSATRRALKQYGFDADFVPSQYDRETLFRELSDTLGPGKVLVLGALPEEEYDLPKGFHLVPLYRTAFRGPAPKVSTKYVVFASSSGVRGVFEEGGSLAGATPVSIGHATAAELNKYDAQGLIAEPHTIDGILAAIRRAEDARQKEGTL